MSTEPPRPQGTSRRGRPSVAWFVVPSVAALVLSGVALGYGFGRRAKSGGVPGGPASRRSDGVEERLVMMEAELRSLRRQAALQAAATRAPATAPDDGGRLHRAAAPSAPRPATEEDMRRYFADLDTRFSAEPRDPVWAANVEEKL